MSEDEKARRIAEAEENQRFREESLYDTGMEKGKAEGLSDATIEIARKMKTDGVSDEIIAKYTGLSVSEIEKL